MILHGIALPQNSQNAHSVFGGRHSVFGGFCDICKNQGRSQARGENPAPRVALYGVFRPAADIEVIRIPAIVRIRIFRAGEFLSAFVGTESAFPYTEKNSSLHCLQIIRRRGFFAGAVVRRCGIRFRGGAAYQSIASSAGGENRPCSVRAKAIFGNSANSRL